MSIHGGKDLVLAILEISSYIISSRYWIKRVDLCNVWFTQKVVTITTLLEEKYFKNNIICKMASLLLVEKGSAITFSFPPFYFNH